MRQLSSLGVMLPGVREFVPVPLFRFCWSSALDAFAPLNARSAIAGNLLTVTYVAVCDAPTVGDSAYRRPATEAETDWSVQASQVFDLESVGVPMVAAPLSTVIPMTRRSAPVESIAVVVAVSLDDPLSELTSENATG